LRSTEETPHQNRREKPVDGDAIQKRISYSQSAQSKARKTCTKTRAKKSWQRREGIQKKKKKHKILPMVHHEETK